LAGQLAMTSPVPAYWDLLDDDDRAGYHRLQEEFLDGNFRHTRNARLEQFDAILERIRQYAERGDGNDARRFLVCGVCWLENAIAVNTRQLRLLVTKCKSSINGSLQKMGYTVQVSHSESWKVLFSRLPGLQGHFAELRQWSVRSRPGAALAAGVLPVFHHFQVMPMGQHAVFVAAQPPLPPKLRRTPERRQAPRDED
jgi:hypothetical protein